MRPGGRWDPVKHKLLPGCVANPSPKQISAMSHAPAHGPGRPMGDPTGRKHVSPTPQVAKIFFALLMAGVLLFARVSKANYMTSIESNG